jgi:ABC-type glycerol-3-phosphate transport system substrate-binding protein
MILELSLMLYIINEMKNKIATAILLLLIPFFSYGCTVAIFLNRKYLTKGRRIRTIVQPVSLSMWGLWESPDIMDAVIKEYQGQNPNVTINYDDRSITKPDQYKETLVTRLQQGGTPDMVLVHNSWVPYIKDYLEPMPSDMLSPQDYSQRFYPVAVESGFLILKFMLSRRTTMV